MKTFTRKDMLKAYQQGVLDKKLSIINKKEINTFQAWMSVNYPNIETVETEL